MVWLSPLGQAKSSRRYPGLLYEPLCSAVGPSTCRSAACITWVPEWAWQAPSRHSPSTAASTPAPVASSPPVTRTRCTIRPFTGLWTSTTSSVTPSPVIVPASESWPPDSA